MTPSEIKSMCEKLLPMTQKESYAFLEGMGICRKNADILRHLLGTTKPKAKEYPIEVRERCRKILETEGLSIPKAAKKAGVTVSTVYNWVWRYNWCAVNSHDFWTERKIIKLIIENKKGTSHGEIAMMIGAKKSQVHSMCQRIKNRSHVDKWLKIIEKMGA